MVFRITGAGQGEPYYDTGQGNVTGLMLDSNGRLLAGTEPNGILYRITAKDKAFALYDSTLPEVRALATGSDGSVYVAGLGGALAKRIQAAQQNQGLQQEAVPTISTTITVTAQSGAEIKPTAPESKPVQPAPAATPTPAATAEAVGVEKSAIYRIYPDNTVDTLWSSKEENVYDILPRENGDLVFVTDQNARIYQLTPNRRLTLLAQTNDGEAVRLLREGDTLLAATANSGKLYRLGAAAAGGTYQSAVFDANATSRWGRFRWDGEGVRIETRSGNSLRPDNSWSDWSPALTDASGSPITSPNARYLQFRASLTTTSAHLDNISAAYLPQNSPPIVRAITVTQQAPPGAPAKTTSSGSQSGTSAFSISVTDTGDAGPVASTGTATQTMSRSAIQSLLLSWTAEDPDSDKLVYELAFRGEGEDQWKVLRRDLHDPYVILDGDALADGRYYFRVTASDRESNPEGSAREAELVSSPILIDNTPPTIRVQSSNRNGATADIAFDAQDAASPLRRAEWSLDAGAWIPVAPSDGVLDSQSEQFRLHVTSIPAGEHLLVLRVADSGG
ncbi:MAG TPA: fibronectin type III domain-containing protein, partial [Bryobacteraceae bacterium]|nr:fibronectin type III domain-containing protein [Bryobacteraceae bacterium]